MKPSGGGVLAGNGLHPEPYCRIRHRADGFQYGSAARWVLQHFTRKGSAFPAGSCQLDFINCSPNQLRIQ